MLQEPKHVLGLGVEHERSNGQLYHVGNDQRRLCMGGILRCENRCSQANNEGKGIPDRWTSSDKHIKVRISLHGYGLQIAQYAWKM